MRPVDSPEGERVIGNDLDRLIHSSLKSDAPDVPEMSDLELTEVTAVTNSLAQLREAERELSESSRSAMNLSEQEMRALQFLVVVVRRGEIVTPSMLASHLRISPASTTKLLNRLERGGHVSRTLHPHDRRAIKIDVNPQTEALTQRSVGRQQARRFYAAVHLTSEERKVVARFLDELTEGMQRDRDDWSRTRSQYALQEPLDLPAVPHAAAEGS